MTERRYTLAEIDAMRDSFRSLMKTVMVDPTDGVDYWPEDYDTTPYPIEINISDEEAEMRLRTAMLGGVDPAEFTNRTGNSADDKTETT